MSKKTLHNAIAIVSSLVFVYLMWSGSITLTEDTTKEPLHDQGAVVAEYATTPDEAEEEDTTFAPTTVSEASFPKITTVMRVIDGDTFVVSMNDKPVTVRLLGIDTPETVHPNKPVECFGREASEYLTYLINQHELVLVLDPTQGAYDKYGRLLAYAYLPDGRSVNEILLRDGFAYEYLYQTPYELHDRYVAIEQKAIDAKRGLWAEGVCQQEESLEVQ